MLFLLKEQFLFVLLYSLCLLKEKMSTSSEFVNAGVDAARRGIYENDMPGDLNPMILEATVGSNDSYIVQQQIHQPVATMMMQRSFPHKYSGISRDDLF